MNNNQHHVLELHDSESSLQACSGEIILLTGNSGSGKSQWLKRLASLIALPADIRVTLNGAVTSQHPARLLADRWPCIWLGQTVAEELLFGLKAQTGIQKLDETLTEWGLPGLNLETEAGTLNRLQSLRLSLAAIALANPALALLDNPSAALSTADAQAVIAEISAWVKTSDTIVVVACNRWQDWQPVASQEWRVSTPDAMPRFIKEQPRGQA